MRQKLQNEWVRDGERVGLKLFHENADKEHLDYLNS